MSLFSKLGDEHVLECNEATSDAAKPVEVNANFEEDGNEPGDTPSGAMQLSVTLITLLGVMLRSGTRINR